MKFNIMSLAAAAAMALGLVWLAALITLASCLAS